jgi:hypothetical protein
MYDNTPSTVAMSGYWWLVEEACMDHASIRHPVFVQWVTAADGLGDVVVL